MNIRFGLVLPTVLLLGSISCAGASDDLNIEKSIVAHHEYDKNNGDTYVLKDDTVFVAKKGFDKSIITTTLFFSGSVDKQALVDKMLWILEATKASDKFLTWAKKNLSRNRRLDKDSFVMPLKSFNMETHEFTLSKTGHNELNILTYRRLKPGQ